MSAILLFFSFFLCLFIVWIGGQGPACHDAAASLSDQNACYSFYVSLFAMRGFSKQETPQPGQKEKGKRETLESFFPTD